MRLLHTTNLELVSFIGKPVQRPPYAILSHTWKDDEFVFEEARDGIHQHLQNPKRGLRKILNACEKARGYNLDYIWVDTCCIDKSSSAELSEAINSMFKWYKESANCYVFMDDVTLQEDGTMGNFDDSRWFTRGWTLQELIAPHGLFFFDCDWNYMCTRDQIVSRLKEITGISHRILQRAHTFSPPKTPRLSGDPSSQCPGCGHLDTVKARLSGEPISRKMAWAANRETTRPEDTSYCLLGLFDINMPLLYGEGQNAFWRLQEEILKKYPDQSILTWTDWQQGEDHRPYLSKTPSAFQVAVRGRENSFIERGDIIATARGLEIDVLFGPCDFRRKGSQSSMSQHQQFMAILSCAIVEDPLARVAIVVEPLTPGAPDTAYSRVNNNTLIQLHPAAEPLVLIREYRDPIRELKDITVDYDPKKLSPSRILLAAIRPMRGLSKQRPKVRIVAPGIGRAEKRVQMWQTSEDTIISYKYPSSSSQDKGVGALSVWGAWYLENGVSGFLAFWGLPVSLVDGDCIAWVETLESFLEGNLSKANLSSLQSNTFGEALRQYLKRCQRSAPTVLATDISEPGLQVKTTVQTVEFLGRKTYRVVLDIDEWEDHPVSILNCQQVLAYWT